MSDQHAIAAGDYEASVAGLGASLRRLTYRGRDLVVPFGADVERPDMRGALLAPWPNRTADGTYEFAGHMHRLAIDEPARRTANHGLVANLPFVRRDGAAHRVVLAATLEPRDGFPWRLALTVTVTVGADGLTHEVEAQNVSDDSAPLGLGVHPYLLAGPAVRDAIDAWTLELPADAAMVVTRDRLLPDRIIHIDRHDGGVLDFREPRVIGSAALNHAFTALRRDADGWARARLTTARGDGVELAVDGMYRWIQAYTADMPSAGPPRAGIALEPMTCPPDALNSKRDLLVVRPGGRATATFRIRGLDVA
ncbi:aldose 1-epimerase family protein [Demequina phytophila]|uniref:aldose 1-epimerase family protein n=1 Tax=Demequina phytophila TaxID=1638981 RepID=UPI0007863EA5|nr:aldose 1-epimerase family protein [Demequina phytophila]